MQDLTLEQLDVHQDLMNKITLQTLDILKPLFQSPNEETRKKAAELKETAVTLYQESCEQIDHCRIRLTEF